MWYYRFCSEDLLMSQMISHMFLPVKVASNENVYCMNKSHFQGKKMHMLLSPLKHTYVLKYDLSIL